MNHFTSLQTSPLFTPSAKLTRRHLYVWSKIKKKLGQTARTFNFIEIIILKFSYLIQFIFHSWLKSTLADKINEQRLKLLTCLFCGGTRHSQRGLTSSRHTDLPINSHLTRFLSLNYRARSCQHWIIRKSTPTLLARIHIPDIKGRCHEILINAAALCVVEWQWRYIHAESRPSEGPFPFGF